MSPITGDYKVLASRITQLQTSLERLKDRAIIIPESWREVLENRADDLNLSVLELTDRILQGYFEQSSSQCS